MTRNAESADRAICPDVEALSAWFDGEEPTVSGGHVAECGACAGKIQAYHHIRRGLAQGWAPAPGLSERIKRACLRERESRRLVSWGLDSFSSRRLATAAALILTLAGAFYFLGGLGTPPATDPGRALTTLGSPQIFNVVEKRAFGLQTAGLSEASLGAFSHFFAAAPLAPAPVAIPAVFRPPPRPSVMPGGQPVRVTLELPGGATPMEVAASVQRGGFTLLSPVSVQISVDGAAAEPRVSYSFELRP